jgi:hypothetical protein
MRRSETFQIALGFAVLAVIGYFVYLGAARIVRSVFPESQSNSVSIAMAAYFTADSAREPVLQVSGTVLERGTPLADGRARVAVRRLNDATEQSVIIPIKDGAFATGEQAAFRDFTRKDRLNVEADVSKRDTASLATQLLYLNAYPPVPPGRLRALSIGLMLIAAVFFWSFTGVATQGKNQAAIIFSYCVMILYLALPFGAFYVLGRYQAVAQAAKEVADSTPVGVLQAVPMNDSDGKPATGLEREWVLNIGGIVVDRPRAARTSPAAPPADVPTPTDATGTPTDHASAVKTPPVEAPTQVTTSTALQTDAPPPEYAIEGGLVIPLYVLVLSIIGGAINMTRMLPIYQREAQTLFDPQAFLHHVGERVWMGTLGTLSSVARFSRGATDDAGADASAELSDAAAGDADRGDASDRAEVPPSNSGQDGTNVTIVTAHPRAGDTASAEPEVEVSLRQRTHDEAGDRAAADDTSAGATAADATSRKSQTTKITVGPKVPAMTPGELAAMWRQGLITQHMYLLSAPFLAIAVFYLLDWLDLRKKALLVLASFSVGLISDKILSAILSVVEPVLKSAGSANGTKVDVKADAT